MNGRINLIIIDKQKNTIEVELPYFMVKELNIDTAQVKKHATKKELNDTLSAFLK